MEAKAKYDFIDKLILEALIQQQITQPRLGVNETDKPKKEEPKASSAEQKPQSKNSGPIPQELIQLRSIMKKHEKDYGRIRLLNPLSHKLWQEMETLRGKKIPYELVQKMSPSEAKSHIKQNPNNIMFLASGDGKLVSATSTNKWIIVPDTDEEAHQVPGDKSTLIVYPTKHVNSDIWQSRGGKKSVWDRARTAYVVDGNLLKRL